VAVPDGTYHTIVIDPPWPMEKIEREVRPRPLHLPRPRRASRNSLAPARAGRRPLITPSLEPDLVVQVLVAVHAQAAGHLAAHPLLPGPRAPAAADAASQDACVRSRRLPVPARYVVRLRVTMPGSNLAAVRRYREVGCLLPRASLCGGCAPGGDRSA
jgi:hypothetical protein